MFLRSGPMGFVFCVGTQLAVTELLKYKSLLRFAAGICCNMLIVRDMTAYSPKAVLMVSTESRSSHPKN